MALAIAVCIGGFTWLYVQLDPWARDFAGVEPAPTATAREQASNSGSNDNQDENDPTEEPKPTYTPEERSTESNQIQQVNSDSGDFSPDYQVTSLEAVNMRSGPGRSFDAVTQINPGTRLEYTGNKEAAPDPDDAGLEWLEFKTENGETGWIRDIDVGKI
jgi:uncharacterized protein YgiM (DUF1202 family)